MESFRNKGAFREILDLRSLRNGALFIIDNNNNNIIIIICSSIHQVAFGRLNYRTQLEQMNF